MPILMLKTLISEGNSPIKTVDWLKWQEKVEQKWIPTQLIDPNPFWTRKTLPKMEKLAQDVQQHGQLQSVLVRPHPIIQGRYQLACGRRRLEAIKYSKMPKIRVAVAELSDQQMLEFAASENLQSEDISPGELAEIIRQMRDQLGYTYKEVGLRIGRSEQEVKEAARLLNLGKEAFSEVSSLTPEKGSFSKIWHFTPLLKIKDEKKQAELAREAVVRGWTRENPCLEGNASGSCGQICPDEPSITTSILSTLGFQQVVASR